jgi:hypothetical protein
VYEPEEIQAVVAVLTEPATPPEEPELEIFDQPDSSSQTASQKKDLLSSQLSAALNTSEPEVIRRLSRRMAFTHRQWLILGALLLVNFLVFIAFILVVLSNT